jgi:hypothetical protein
MNIFIKPADPATVVRQPDRDMRPLAENGEWVTSTPFWELRLLHRDVVETAPPEEPKVKAKVP